MFRCCECGTKFKIKPDFCDCGNDVFEEITMEVNAADKPSKQYRKKTFSEQYPGISAFLRTLDPISVIIFICCILLSAAALIFINPSEQEIADNTNQKNIVKNIKVADINSFWDDTPPAEKEISINIEATKTITDIKPQQEEPKVEQITIKPKTQQTSMPQPSKNTNTIAQKSPQAKPAVQKTTQNKTQAPKPKQVKPQTQNTQNIANNTASQQTVSQKQSQQPVQQQTKTQTQQSSNVTQPAQQTQPTVDYAAIQAQAAQELKNYKNGLRNTLFSKINFTKVYGDGSCIVDFKINSSGKLVNRSFSKQSTNNTLNDEVYSAIINTPSYKVPPNSYKGQFLHFSVKFTNGHYDVSLY